MLQIALAGLVLNKVLTIKQAEAVFNSLKEKKVPDTVKDCVKELKLKIKQKYETKQRRKNNH